MRKFRGIVQSKTEPQDKEILWYYKDKLLYYNNGSWEPFVTSGSSSSGLELGETKGTAYEGSKGKSLSDKVANIESILEDLPTGDAVTNISNFTQSDTDAQLTITYGNGETDTISIGVADESVVGLMGVEDTKKIRNLKNYVTDIDLIQGQEFEKELVLYKSTNEGNFNIPIPTANNNCNGLLDSKYYSDILFLHNGVSKEGFIIGGSNYDISNYVTYEDDVANKAINFTIKSNSLTQLSKVNLTLPIAYATSTTAGIMPAEDKILVDWFKNSDNSKKGIVAFAEETKDFIKIEYSKEAAEITFKTYNPLDASETESIAYIYCADKNWPGLMSPRDKTNLSDVVSKCKQVTTDTDGLMIAADKAKLDNITTVGTNLFLDDITDTYLSLGLDVINPATGEGIGSYLELPSAQPTTDTGIGTAGLMSAEDKAKLDKLDGSTKILTKAEYDALTTKSDDVVYFIKG